MLADDLGDLFLLVLLRGLRVGFIRLAERQSNGRAHLAFLRTVRLIDQEGDSQVLQLGFVFDLIQHPRELLLRGDDDGLALSEKARQIGGVSRQTDDVFQVREVLDVFPDIGVERLPVGEDE